MYISEIPPNTEITIKVRQGTHEIELNTLSIEPSEALGNQLTMIEKRLNSKVLLINPVEVDNQIIKFNDRNSDSDKGTIHLDIEAIVNNKSYLWHNVVINNVLGRYNIVISKDNIEFKNRRDNFRVSVGLKAFISIGHKTEEGTVKDLSNSGLGLVVDKQLRANIGDTIRVHFEDILRKSSFNIECNIVRVEELNERKSLIGCVIVNIRPNPSYYINRLQREELKRHNE